MKPTRPIAAALLMTMVLGGCGGDRGRSATATERLAASPIEHADYRAMGYRLDWRGFPMVSRGFAVKFIQPAGDVLATLDSAGVVSILEDSNGATRSTNGLASGLTTFLGIDRVDDRLVVMADTEVFILDVRTGALTDRQPFDRLANTGMLRSGELIVFGTTTGELSSHILTNGIRPWGFAASGSFDYTPVRVSRPSGDAAGAVSRDGTVVFVVADTGKLLGRGKLFGGPGAAPASGDGLMFVACLDQSLYAIAPDGAKERWRYRTEYPITAAPTHHDGVVYCELRGRGIVAFRASSGEVLWESPEVTGKVIAMNGDKLLAWDADARVAHTLDRATGDPAARVDIPTVAMIHAEGFENAVVYTVSDAGVVSKFLPN